MATDGPEILESMPEAAVNTIVAQALVDLFNHAWQLGYAAGFELGKSTAEVAAAAKDRREDRDP